jgi:hypothetical protein
MLGSYRTPRIRLGHQVECEIRGRVTVLYISDSPIQWPWARSGVRDRPSPVIFRGLSRALRTEAAVEICKAWGITSQTVTKWRKKLGLSSRTPGQLDRRRRIMRGPLGKQLRRLAYPTLRSPTRRAKIAASKLGKKRPGALRK